MRDEIGIHVYPGSYDGIYGAQRRDHSPVSRRARQPGKVSKTEQSTEVRVRSGSPKNKTLRKSSERNKNK
ncbi:MAG: hypothetical protein R2827_15875 [Bdellovibrionales bacterium]